MTVERWQECVLAASAILWAWLFLTHGDTFGGVERYAALNRYMSDDAWFAWLTFGALLLLAGQFLPLSFAWRFRLRSAGHALLSFLYIAVGVIVYTRGYAIPRVALSAPFCTLTLLHLFAFLRTRGWQRLT